MHAHDLAMLLIGLAGAVSLALTALAAGAWRRAGNRKLAFVAAAFALFAVKAAVTLYSLGTGLLGHEDLEVAGSAFDLAIVFLLAAPFLRR